MSISDNQKLDFLWKKLGYGATKTDVNSVKTATNESIPSPLLLSGTGLWTDAYQIPTLIPSASSHIVEIYDDTGNGSTTVETVEDTSSIIVQGQTVLGNPSPNLTSKRIIV
mgnify:CR=1 FL=1